MSSLFSNSDSGTSRLSLGSFSSAGESILSIPSYSESIRGCPEYSLPNDELPSYRPTLQFFGVCLVETEFYTPYSPNSKRKCEPMIMELNSTQVVLYEMNCDKQLKTLISALIKFNNSDDKKTQAKQNTKVLDKWYTSVAENGLLFEPVEDQTAFIQIIHQYQCKEYRRMTLNRSQVGVAPDLTSGTDQDVVTLVQYKNCLRLRIESHQLLLHFWSFNSMINWYRNLKIGKDLCNFDSISRSKTMPRYEIFRQLDHLSDTKTPIGPNEVDINGYKLYINNNYTVYEVSCIKSCLEVLNSFDPWKSLILSNIEEDKLHKQDLYLSCRKLKEIARRSRSRSLKCREFSVESEGLVSVAC